MYNLNRRFPSQRSATHLINFVKRYDEVARLIGDGSRVQVVCPELDQNSEFIKIIIERYKADLVLHDGGYTLNGLKEISLADQAELNCLLDVYNVEPLMGRSRHLQIITTRADYSYCKQYLCEAIQMVEKFFESRNLQYM